jgi:Uma2 family endonuclease
MVATPEFDYTGTYDENWPLPTHLTLEQYRSVIFRPDAHFVDGQIIPRNLGNYTHGHAIGVLIGALHGPCKELRLQSCISLRLQTSRTRVRVCDFVVLNADVPYEPVPTVPPLLCIEVLSPDQDPDTELDVLADYLAMGVPNIWLIDPVACAAYTFEAGALREADPKNLTIPNTQIGLALTEAFFAIG